MKILDEKRLTEIEGRLISITPGPWIRVGGIPSVETHAHYSLLNKNRIIDTADVKAEFCGVCHAPKFDANWEEAWNDLEFIAHSREDVPDLVAEVRRLQNSLNASEQECRDLHRSAAAYRIDKIGYLMLINELLSKYESAKAAYIGETSIGLNDLIKMQEEVRQYKDHIQKLFG